MFMRVQELGFKVIDGKYRIVFKFNGHGCDGMKKKGGNGFECFGKCNIFCFVDLGKETSAVFWYLGMYVSIE